MLEERLIELLREIDLDAVGEEIRRRSERAMRKAIRELPDGEYTSTVEHDGFEERIVIQCRIVVRGDRLHIDYTGTTPQLPRAVNVVPIYTFAYSAYPIKALLSPNIPNNEGAFLPITTWAPAPWASAHSSVASQGAVRRQEGRASAQRFSGAQTGRAVDERVIGRRAGAGSQVRVRRF